jgi:predicted Zn-dependent protease
MKRHFCPWFPVGRWRLILALLLAGMVLLGTASGPVAPQAKADGRNFFQAIGGWLSPVTPQQERQVGERLHAQLLQKYPPVSDAALQNRVQQVGQRLNTQAHVPITYTAVQGREVNAFAGPGGYVYITTGLLEIMDNDDQLAGVLAHEAAHVSQRHVVRQLQANTATSLALALTQQFTGSGAVAQLGQWGRVLLLQQYSRQDEFEADAVGVRQMHQAGYNPAGMLQTLQKLGQMDRGGLRIPFLQTHPSSTDRITALQRRIGRLSPR